jgi:hypothetical protein
MYGVIIYESVCGEIKDVLVLVKLPHFWLKTPSIGNFKLFATDITEVLTVQTCRLKASFSVKTRTDSEIVNDLKYELYDL